MTCWAETNNYTLYKRNKTFSSLNRVTSFGSLVNELQLWGSAFCEAVWWRFLLSSIICWRWLMKASIISDMNSSRRFLEAVPVCSNPIVPTQTMYNCVSATSELTLWSIMCWQLSSFVCLPALTGTQKGREVTLKDNLNVTTTKKTQPKICLKNLLDHSYANICDIFTPRGVCVSRQHKCSAGLTYQHPSVHVCREYLLQRGS